MSTLETVNETNNQELNENDIEEIGNRTHYILKSENEKCRQEIYDLKRKLELNETMLRETQEANELLEHSLESQVSQTERIIHETKEKQRITIKEYENTISSLETKLAKQTTEIEQLHQQINQQKETESMHMATIDKLANISLEADKISLQKCELEQLNTLLHLEIQKRKSAEETIKELKAQYNELLLKLQNTTKQLYENSTALEEVRAELALSRAEIESLNTKPANDLLKGNSLFAEVEDLRRGMVSKMNVLNRKYAEVKRKCAEQMAEIKILQSKQVTMLSKCENSTGTASAEMDELLQKYKSRVADLERKLKSEMKKNNDSDQEKLESMTVGQYQSLLLCAKKKEIDELRVKVENLSRQFLVQEEAKMNLNKQLQYSQYKISLLEAQVQASQGELKLNQEGDNVDTKMQLKEIQDVTHADNNNVMNVNTKVVSEQQSSGTVSIIHSDSIKTEKCTNRNIMVEETITSTEAYNLNNVEVVKQDKNNCPTKNVQFSHNIIYIQTNDI
ncbi:spindle apparatus coiled-coil protein 1 spindly [Augochlora pura]